MANVVEFTIKGVDKGSGVLGKFSKTAAGTVKSVAKMTTGVTALSSAVFAYVAVVNSGLDKQAKFAKRIGVSVVELTTMQHAAEMASIPIEQFNMATQRMTRRAAEAAQGMGEASGALRELNIDARSFGKLGLNDQMATLADRFSEVKNPADQLRLAFKLFDSEGTAMLQMLKDGSPALQQAANDARYLGIVLSKQGAANAEKFSDEMTRAQGAVKGLGMGLSEELTPLLTGLLGKFTDFVAQGRPAFVAFVKDAIANITTLGIVMGQVWAKVSGFIDTVFTREGFQEFVDGAKDAMGWVIDLFIQGGPILARTLLASFNVAWESFTELAQWGFESMLDAITGNDVADSLTEVLYGKIPAATAKTRAEVSALWDELGTFSTEKGAEISSALTSTFGINVELARTQAAELVSSLETFGTVAEEQQAAITEAQTGFLEAFYSKNLEFMTAQKEAAVELAESTYDLMMSTIEAISDSVAGVIVEGGNMLDAFRSIGQMVLKEMLSMLIKIGLQRLVTAAISNAATATQASAELSKGAATTYMNAFSSTAAIPIIGPSLAPGVAAASTAAATAGATAAGAAGSALGTTIAGARADGGPVGMGQTYLVGERGPELFTPRSNGNIISNEDLTGGEGVVIENLTISVLENVTNASALLEMTPEAMREVVADKIIPALDSLARRGTRPQYLME